MEGSSTWSGRVVFGDRLAGGIVSWNSITVTLQTELTGQTHLQKYVAKMVGNAEASYLAATRHHYLLCILDERYHAGLY